MSWLQRWQWGRLDDETFCRRLTLEGWELLAPVAEESGVVLVSSGDDLWPVTVAAIGLYLGPVDLVARKGRLKELPASWRRSFVGRVLEPETAEGPASNTLRDDGRVVIVGADESDALAGPLSSATDAPTFSATADSPEKKRFRLIIRPQTET